VLVTEPLCADDRL